MRNFAVHTGFLLLFFGSSIAVAQSPEPESLELRDSGRLYLGTVGRRVDSEVVYYNPNGSAPELSTREIPRESEQDAAGGGTVPSKHVFTALAVLVLLVIATQVWRFGAPVSVSLRRQPGDRARAVRDGGGHLEENEAAPLALPEIIALQNWDIALVELARSALAKAAEQNGMRWQSSWTARDLLRRLPRDVAEALRPLVWTAEHIQFGNRTVDEDEFRYFANGVSPMLPGGDA